MKTYQQLAAESHFCTSVLSSAANGKRLPTVEVTRAYVQACGGSVPEWLYRWKCEARTHRPHRWRR